jgi:malonate decarboxylase gamma subunit MdcE/phosphoribosyl-dephospho-CoA transferase MdcG
MAGLHQGMAAATDAYHAARNAGHPIVAVVGIALSGGFLTHGLQAGQILALDDPHVEIHAMHEAAAARITLRTVEQLDELAKTIVPMSYDVRDWAKLAFCDGLFAVDDADAPTPDDVRKVSAAVSDAVERARRGPRDLSNRLDSEAAITTRHASRAVRDCLLGSGTQIRSRDTATTARPAQAVRRGSGFVACRRAVVGQPRADGHAVGGGPAGSGARWAHRGRHPRKRQIPAPCVERRAAGRPPVGPSGRFTDVDPTTGNEVAAIGALRSVRPFLDEAEVPWGPTGSVGFELTTGSPTASADSDLDLLVRTPHVTSAVLSRLTTLHHHFDRLEVRVDCQVETRTGAIALPELLSTSHDVLVKTPLGPRLLQRALAVR